MEYLTDVFIPYLNVLFPLLIEGLKVTIWVSLLAFILSVIIGVLLATIRHFEVKGLSKLVEIYVSYFRGTPVLIQLFLLYYGAPLIFEPMKNCPKQLALIICLAFNSAAYISESVRGAIDSIDKGQYEAGVVFGISRFQIMKNIVLPQAAVAAIPPMTNTCMDIIKMSSLGMTIGIQDIMGQAQLTAATSYKIFETYIIAALMYWILSVLLGKVQTYIEKKVSNAYRK